MPSSSKLAKKIDIEEAKKNHAKLPEKALIARKNLKKCTNMLRARKSKYRALLLESQLICESIKDKYDIRDSIKSLEDEQARLHTKLLYLWKDANSKFCYKIGRVLDNHACRCRSCFPFNFVDSMPSHCKLPCLLCERPCDFNAEHIRYFPGWWTVKGLLTTGLMSYYEPGDAISENKIENMMTLDEWKSLVEHAAGKAKWHFSTETLIPCYLCNKAGDDVPFKAEREDMLKYETCPDFWKTKDFWFKL